MRPAYAPPRRIALDLNTLRALLPRAGRLGRYQLKVETNRHGDTVAFLERCPTPVLPHA